MADRSGYIGRNPGDSAVIIATQVYTISGASVTDFTFTATYTVGYLDAYLNGVRLINSTDYTASDGNTISLVIPAEDGDTLEFVAYKAFNVATVSDAPGDFEIGGTINPTGAAATTGGALYVGGDLYVQDDLTFDEFTATNANVTGVATIGTLYASGGVSTSFVSAVGIQSAGTAIGAGITQLNFVGTGNSIIQGASGTVDIQITGGGGGGVSTTGIATGLGWMNDAKLSSSLDLNDYYGEGSNCIMGGPITVSGAGTTITVGAGVSYIII